MVSCSDSCAACRGARTYRDRQVTAPAPEGQ